MLFRNMRARRENSGPGTGKGRSNPARTCKKQSFLKQAMFRFSRGWWYALNMYNIYVLGTYTNLLNKSSVNTNMYYFHTHIPLETIVRQRRKTKCVFNSMFSVHKCKRYISNIKEHMFLNTLLCLSVFGHRVKNTWKHIMFFWTSLVQHLEQHIMCFIDVQPWELAEREFRLTGRAGKGGRRRSSSSTLYAHISPHQHWGLLISPHASCGAFPVRDISKEIRSPLTPIIS